MKVKAKQAIILAAGEGKRLRPLTDTIPKCLVEVNGLTILENALNGLMVGGVKRVTIVIGYLGKVIQQHIGNNYKEMHIEYVENPIYSVTNSMYSLYLGLKDIDSSTWVVESDVFWEHSLVNLPMGQGISWLSDSSQSMLDGAYIQSNEEHKAVALQIIRDMSLVRENYYKSAGILYLSASAICQVKNWLVQAVGEKKTNLYYDLILAEHLLEADIHIVDIKGTKWFEIDNMEDLITARKLFA